MHCTGWRLGISPVIWPSIRNARERPMSGTDCTSRKCKIGNIVRRYTICKTRGKLQPRLRIYDDHRMIASMTVSSFEWGQAYVDRIIGGSRPVGLGCRRRARR